MRTVPAFWREWETGDGLPLSALRILVLFCGLLFLAFTAVLGLPWPQQAIVAALTIAIAIWLDRSSSSYLVTLTLMFLSVYSTCRYGFWRLATTGAALHGRWLSLDALFMGLLLLSECYAFVVLLLGYMQMVWPLRRTPVPVPDDPADWPSVDVLIPTLNEPLDVVRFTALAALNMDWPAEKLNVYILDDGRRAEFRAFAEEAGLGYMTRPDNRDAKAGNLNAALERLDSPFVVVFDADHVPTRSFLQVTMGWFLRDTRLGILQTPHHFYSPDPFERNLGQFRAIPNEDELFYGVVQDGNDFWNATYFCGSCAVLRRSALDDAGGLATETVTEDAHTSMRMQRLGWNSAYINIPQAAGLATERLSAHVRQRIRWARGMVQILRLENPMFGPGLNVPQRLCYLNAMSHFLYAIPRMVFLTAPLMYLIFGYINIAGYWAAILAYAVPHLVISSLARSRIQGAHRHSFWTEIYETVLAPYLVFPTLGALLHPRRGRFTVTPKGDTVESDYFDVQMARPTLILLACNWFGLCCAWPRLVQFPSWDVPMWAAFVNWPASLYDAAHAGTIATNAAWTLFNLALLGVALAVAWEHQQRRKSVRVETKVASEVVLADGSVVRGITSDLSSGGVRTTMEYDISAAPGDAIQFVFPVLDGTAVLPARVVALEGRTLRARFDDLNLEEYEALTMILYARADRWLGWGESRDVDSPVRSLALVLRLALKGLRQAFFGPAWEGEWPRRTWATTIVPMAVLGLMLLTPRAGGEQATEHPGAPAHAAADPLSAMIPPPRAKVVRAPAKPTAQGRVHSLMTLADYGVAAPIALRGLESSRTVPFSIPQTELVDAAVLRLRYQFSPALLPSLSLLQVSLNGTPIASIPVNRPAAPAIAASSLDEPRPGDRWEPARKSEQAPVLESTVTLPAELLQRTNQLSFHFVGHDARECFDPAHSGLWSHIQPDSTIELAGSTVPLQDDLAILPMPLYQPGMTTRPTIPIVFLKPPSPKAMEAAAIVASWFGVLADATPIRFPVAIGAIPKGNAVVIAEGRGSIPAGLALNTPPGAALAIKTNPADTFSKLLVLSGDSGDDLLKAARILASAHDSLQGAEASLNGAPEPAAAPVSPRWLSTARGEPSTFATSADTSDLEGDGTQPAAVFLRLPPDLYFGQETYGQVPSSVYGQGVVALPLHLHYRYNAQAAGPGSTLQVWVNGQFVRSVPLAHGDRASAAEDAVVPIPVSLLRPFSNTLLFQFAARPAGSATCPAAGSGFSGTILGDSYLDVQGVPHRTHLPNLELFANAGFPFTRTADLAATRVVLPAEPTPAELELLFTLMGHLGAQTGVPALHLAVSGPEGLAHPGGRDVLLLGTFADQPALGSAAAALPVAGGADGLHLRRDAGDLNASSWWAARPAHETAPDLGGPGNPPEALLQAAEWPAGSGHSLVAITLRDDAAVPAFLNAFLATSQSSAIAQSVSIFRGGSFSSWRAGPTFAIGSLPPLLRLTLAVEQFPWVLALAGVLFCFLLASILRTQLRRSARVRLQGSL